MACLIDDRSSPSLVGSRRGDWQSERLFKNKNKTKKKKKKKKANRCAACVVVAAAAVDDAAAAVAMCDRPVCYRQCRIQFIMHMTINLRFSVHFRTGV